LSWEQASNLRFQVTLKYGGYILHIGIKLCLAEVTSLTAGLYNNDQGVTYWHCTRPTNIPVNIGAPDPF
jgi:hypothetical protein